MKLHQFTLYHFLNEYNKNREVINAYLNNQSIEGYGEAGNVPTISGVSIGVFIAIFVFALGIWIWALVITIKFWNFIPTWAKIFALIGLFTGIGGPVLTLIVVYVSKSNKKVK